MPSSLSKLALAAVAAHQQQAAAAAVVVLQAYEEHCRQQQRQAGQQPKKLGQGGRGGKRTYNGRRKRRPWLNGKASRHRGGETQWEPYLEGDAVKDEGEILGEEFVQKFRVPYRLYESILRDTRRSGQFADNPEDDPLGEVPRRRGPKGIKHGLQLKVLSALRYLALGIPVSGCECLSGISTSVLQRFFADWFPWFVETYFPDWVRMPTGAERDKHERLFRMVGLPGCVSSMDVCQFRCCTPFPPL